MPRTLVAKFGGSSLASAERIQHAARLVGRMDSDARRLVTVSALGGVTDDLLGAVEEALARSGRHGARLDAIRHRHETIIDALPEAEQPTLRVHLGGLWRELGELLDGVFLLRECTDRTRDAVVSFGERASAPLVAAFLRAGGHDAQALDARELIRADRPFGEGEVDFKTTRLQVRTFMETAPRSTIHVVTGFIASTKDAVTITLGRSGSDYTATILAGALDADEVTIWTDVTGVLSADPRLVPEAFTLDKLNYQEAAELAHFGAKVLHPRTMRPLVAGGIPLVTKNTLDPDQPGTLVSHDTTDSAEHVKAISSIGDTSVVTLEGPGLVGVVGVAARAFGALSGAGVNVLMISQASSEGSICCVIRRHDQEEAVAAWNEAFASEMDRGQISPVSVQADSSVLAVVGENMRDRPGIAGRMLETLGQARINVRAIAQGSSERNISVAVGKDQVGAAVRALHEAFPLARLRTHIFVIGVGVVGKKVLDFIEQQALPLIESDALNLRLVGVASSKKYAFAPEGLADPLEALQGGEALDLGALVDTLAASTLERLVVIDATASAEVAHRYPVLLDAGIAVVTPNKRACTLDLAFYDRLKAAARSRRVPFLYETTVGAGLPVISTLRDLIRSGDRVEKVEGVFSGTLAFLFSQLDEGAPFSEAVRKAKEKGLTEPDPRDDLSGEDVARKLLILAREMGLRVERADVTVESLVPSDLLGGSVGDFLAGLEAQDAAWKTRIAEADARGERLRYIGRVEADGTLRVGVQAVPEAGPFGSLRGTDNLIVFTTARYHDTPLVVQGPGAGPDVTAAVVLADALRAAELF